MKKHHAPQLMDIMSAEYAQPIPARVVDNEDSFEAEFFSKAHVLPAGIAGRNRTRNPGYHRPSEWCKPESSSEEGRSEPMLLALGIVSAPGAYLFRDVARNTMLMLKPSSVEVLVACLHAHPEASARTNPLSAHTGPRAHSRSAQESQ